MNNYANAYAEVYTILKYLKPEERNKIPQNFIKTIKENKNDNYILYIDWSKELKEQNLLIETRAILFNIFKDYLATKTQRDKIGKMQREEIYRNELNKKSNYNSDIIFKRKKFGH